jgi:hypothetical protein
LKRNIQQHSCSRFPYLCVWILLAVFQATDLLAATSKPVFTEVLIESGTTFETGKADFTSAAPFALDEVMERLGSYQNVSEINIVGHACDSVPGISERELSERRARAVAYYFRTNGLDSIPINVVAPDELYIKYGNSKDPGFSDKSRVEILFAGEVTEPPAEPDSPSIVSWQDHAKDLQNEAVTPADQPCIAEIQSELPDLMQGFTVGQLVFTPTIGLSLGYDQNVTLANDTNNKVESWYLVVSPGIRMELPSDRSSLAVSYEIDAGYYEGSSVDDYIDHTLRAEYFFDPTTRTDLGLFAEYSRGHERRGEGTRAGDTGLIPVEPDEYDYFAFGGHWSYGAVGSRGKIELRAGIADFDFENNLSQAIDRDRDEFFWGGIFYWRIAPKTSALFEYRWRDIDYADTDVSFDSEEERFLIGLTWDASARTTGTLKYGWLEKTFDAPDRAPYDGTTWEVGIDWRPRSYSVFSLKATRETDETDGFGDFVLREDISLDWHHNWNSQFGTTLGLGFGSDDHRPDVREDDFFYIGVSGRYQFRPWLQLGGGLKYHERESNDAEFDYDGLEYLISIELTF